MTKKLWIRLFNKGKTSYLGNHLLHSRLGCVPIASNAREMQKCVCWATSHWRFYAPAAPLSRCLKMLREMTRIKSFKKFDVKREIRSEVIFSASWTSRMRQSHKN